MSARSVLLIEPEASIRELLYICLRESGSWRVTLSRSVQEGVRLCQEISPDTILLDTSTSEIDALLFIEQLKQHSIIRSIPILLITARASLFTAEQIRKMGFAGSIAKPFNLSILPAQIASLLEPYPSEKIAQTGVSQANLAIVPLEESAD